MASSHSNPRRPIKRDGHERTPKQDNDSHAAFLDRDPAHDKLSKGTSLKDIIDICRRPPQMPDMDQISDRNTLFMIAPFKYDPSRPDRMPKKINNGKDYTDQWNEYYVRMPYSPKYTFKNKEPLWPTIHDQLSHLREKCNNNRATFEDLKATIEDCAGRQYDMFSLEILINKIYSKSECDTFMSVVLSNICSLALHVGSHCGQPPPLLRIGSNQSVTMSQVQAASLLACAFFCAFPYRSEHDQTSEYQNFQNPNFNGLYKRGPQAQIEKLKCILNYFRRVTEKLPEGVISFRRYALHNNDYPKWSTSKANLCDMHLTTSEKIEDVKCVLQVDFANQYIGGGVLDSGCVQEEIRFSICPEMLVSLLICEVMEPNECVFLIGCERYSSYDGYADSFKFAGDYRDDTPKDNWGRKWCHLVAMDAIFFRERAKQYDMKYVNRELIKAFASFRPRKTQRKAENLFGIATGNWGCGVFNGDRQLKAIIQLMAASEAGRPLIYAAYLDNQLFTSFAEVYEYLKVQRATVGDLYRCLELYSTQYTRGSLFNYILNTPIFSSKFE